MLINGFTDNHSQLLQGYDIIRPYFLLILIILLWVAVSEPFLLGVVNCLEPKYEPHDLDFFGVMRRECI